MNGHGLIGRMLGDQMIVNGMLVVIAVSTLTFAYVICDVPTPSAPRPRPAAERALQGPAGP